MKRNTIKHPAKKTDLYQSQKKLYTSTAHVSVCRQLKSVLGNINVPLRLQSQTKTFRGEAGPQTPPPLHFSERNTGVHTN